MNLGTKIAEAVANWGELPVEVHVMAADPEAVLRLLDGLKLASIAVHLESTRYPRRLLRMVSETGRRAGLAINPATTVPDLRVLDPYLDFVLVLTTDPEDGEATFIAPRLDAVREVASQLSGRGIPIIVDGGVNEVNAVQLVEAGATGAVVGRALFSAQSMAATIAAIRTAEPV